MGLSNYQIASLKADRDRTKAQLDMLNSTYERAISSDAQHLEFASGEGKQRISKRKLDEIQGQINYLQAKLGQIERKLQPGGGIASMRARWI